MSLSEFSHSPLMNHKASSHRYFGRGKRNAWLPVVLMLIFQILLTSCERPPFPLVVHYMPEEYTDQRVIDSSEPITLPLHEADQLLDKQSNEAVDRTSDPWPKIDFSQKMERFAIWMADTFEPLVEWWDEFEPRFGRPTEDKGVAVLQANAECKGCTQRFLYPRRNQQGKWEFRIVLRCPMCQACYHRNCLNEGLWERPQCRSCGTSLAPRPDFPELHSIDMPMYRQIFGIGHAGVVLRSIIAFLLLLSTPALLSAITDYGGRLG